MRKRSVTINELETAISQIEATLQPAIDREVTSSRIGELIMEKLKILMKLFMFALCPFIRLLTVLKRLGTKFPRCNIII